jgi:hypothetical protein
VSRISRSVRWASSGLLVAALAATSQTRTAQQPGQDEREIPPTAGVTPIDTPAIARTSVTPLHRATPATTRTPRPAAAGIADTDGRPLLRPAHARSERRETRSAGTWTLFSVLVVALGWVTIRMRRHRFDPESLPEPMDLDVPPGSCPSPYTYP